MKLLNKTISEVSQLLDERKISSVELTKEVFEHVKKVEPKVKAFITLCEKEAMAQAKESDKLHATNNKRRSIIDGIPISIKDILCTKDIKTTAGSKMLEDFIPSYDSTVVKRLRDAGAVIIGKTNLDAWGHGSSTENSDFFASRNPWNTDYVPGGSSGGSAAAVASGMGFASIGTDTGGSIRQPAALCGITGLKTSYGRCSRYGYIAMASSLDTAGPMVRSAEDAAIMLEIIGGHDKLDSTTIPNRKFSAENILQKSKIKNQNGKLKLKNIKIGIPKEYFTKGLDPQIAQKIEDAKKVLEKLGAKFVDISLPMTDYALACYYIIQPAEVSSNLARFDGMRFGYSAEKLKTRNEKLKTVVDYYNFNRAQGFGAEAKRRIMVGTYVLSAGYYDAYYKKAMKVRTLVIKDFENAFQKVDAILTPTTPSPAFKFGEKTSDPIKMYLEDVYTVSASIAGICGISVPCGFIENEKLKTKNEKLPIGMQILGPQFGEEIILNIANAYQNNTNWHKQTPEL